MQISTEAIADRVNAEFNFEVDKFPLSGPDGMTTPLYGLFRSDNGKLVGSSSVTKRYVPHTRDDVAALVEAAAEAFEGNVNFGCSFVDGHYVKIQPGDDTRRAIYGTSDNVFPRVIIRAGYDGKAFSATMGYYRDLCSNLSMLRQVSGTNVAIRHTSGLRPKMDELIKQFETLKESWGSLAGVIEHMQGVDVSMVDFLNAVYGEPGDSQRAITRHENRTAAIMRRVLSERARSGRPKIDNSTFEVSVWEAFNSVQGYVQHEATRKGSPASDVRVIQALNDKAVKTAEFEAMKLLSV